MCSLQPWHNALREYITSLLTGKLFFFMLLEAKDFGPDQVRRLFTGFARDFNRSVLNLWS
jgi:hypothetical protein